MLRLFSRISSDILNGRNLEAYVVTGVAVVIAVLGLVGDVIGLEVQIAVLLAAVGLLVFQSTAPSDAQVRLDDVLRDRQSFGKFSDFIKGGKVLWIYGPSAVTVMDSASDLEREILTRGGEVRVLLQDPNQKASIDMLHYQLDNMLSHMLESDIERSVAILKALSKRHPKVSYRFAAYSPGFSLVVLDPDGRNGRAIVELFGVTNEVINDRMHIEIHREGSHYWFEHWSRQFELMWDNAREPDPETGL